MNPLFAFCDVVLNPLIPLALKFGGTVSLETEKTKWDGFQHTLENPWLLIDLQGNVRDIIARENVEKLMIVQGNFVFQADFVTLDSKNEYFALKVHLDKDQDIYFKTLESWLLFVHHQIQPRPIDTERFVIGWTKNQKVFSVGAWRKGSVEEQSLFLEKYFEWNSLLPTEYQKQKDTSPFQKEVREKTELFGTVEVEDYDIEKCPKPVKRNREDEQKELESLLGFFSQKSR